jgi:hypothetical protein
MRYRAVLGARGTVGVRGAGVALTGLWFVKAVTSAAERGAYAQAARLTAAAILLIGAIWRGRLPGL